MKSKYSKKTMTALKKSIQHWQENYEGECCDIDIYSEDCPLCKLFIDKGCQGCPIRDYTNWTGCEGSPWMKVEKMYYDYYNASADSYEEYKRIKRRLKAAVKKELDFLTKLYDNLTVKDS